MSNNRMLQFPAAFFLIFTATAALEAAGSSAFPFQPAESSPWRQQGDFTVVELAGNRPATATFTVPADGAGFYAVTDSRIRRDAVVAGHIEFGLSVRHAGARLEEQPPPAVLTTLDAGELFDFDAFLGYLVPGDTVHLTVGAAHDGPAGDRAELDCRMVKTPFIPVSVLAEDIGPAAGAITPGAWSISVDVPANSPAARRLAWGRNPAPNPAKSPGSVRVTMPGGSSDALATFAVPQSGYYALHDAWLSALDQAVEVRLFVGMEATERRRFRAEPKGARLSLNTDLGYIAKGELVHMVLAGSAGPATVDLGAAIIEWAPRRAPLRVRRGNDGYLDVLEPEAPRVAVDIPVDRWTTVPATAGDATEAIRHAFTQAAARALAGGYAGVRLERGRTYALASQQPRGRVFDLRGMERVVFDGNGATLHIGSDEMARLELQLFHVTGGRNLVFADFTATGAEIPFTTGEILDVKPRGENESTQTVTFRVDPGELDPLKDIARNGRSNAYAYDPKIPGRLGVGTWTHYPGNGDPSIRATDTPGVFTHRVTRTNNSIEPGMKWLIKNKNAGVIYLETRGGTENITLTGVDGRASGGGQLRFWQTSGINILDSRFEPDGENWISSSADGVHGRGREGVWIENTLIRGICEDVMNTYGQNMAIEGDDNPDDAVMSVRMFERSGEAAGGRVLRVPQEENVAVGDQLVFFNPNSGRVLGYADVLAVAGGRYTLSNAVPGVEFWDPADRRAVTMVYNTRVAGRFFVRDTRLMDSMRFGIYIKARGGVIFGSQFEGLSGPSVFATNEPEWPEGPPATHLWVQGCTFSQNNYGFMPRHRDFMVVDPADISVYTRRFRQPDEPDDHRANLTHDQYANSHVKLLGNVFHDWRGMGISVRNSRNVRIEDNLFLAPVDDAVMRKTLSADPVLNEGGRGSYAAIHLDSVGGARVAGNRFHGLPSGDRALAKGGDVTGIVETDNVAIALPAEGARVVLSFDEWFGPDTTEAKGIGRAGDRATLGGATHRAGRLGAGLHFKGGPPVRLAASGDLPETLDEYGVAIWASTEDVTATQVVQAAGDERSGWVIALDQGRWTAGLWRDEQGVWLDLGPAVSGQWQHLALSVYGGKIAAAYVDGLEAAVAKLDRVPRKVRATAPVLGGLVSPTRLSAIRVLQPGEGGFKGDLDEFRLFPRVMGAPDLSALVLRRVP